VVEMYILDMKTTHPYACFVWGKRSGDIEICRN